MRSLLQLLFLALASSLAQATTWNLADVTFDDGGVATGSFDYDASTGRYSNVAISVSAGSTLSATNYGVIVELGLTDDSFFTFEQAAQDLTDQRVIQLFFSTPLTDLGGTVALDLNRFNVEGVCQDAGCLFLNPNIRRVLGGFVSSVASRVPEPGPLGLFGIGAFCMIWARRRRLQG